MASGYTSRHLLRQYPGAIGGQSRRATPLTRKPAQLAKPHPPTHICPDAVTYYFVGEAETYVVPTGITQVHVTAVSPSLVDEIVGQSVRVEGFRTVTPGETLYVRVGGRGDTTSGGFNGGGNPGAPNTLTPFDPNGGNGATDVRQGGDTLADRIVVAGAPGGIGLGSTDEYASGADPIVPSVIDGGLPDGSGLLFGDSGDSATQSTPGAGEGVQESGSYHYGDAGASGSLGVGGDGGDGADYVIAYSDNPSGTLSGPATLSNGSNLGTYASGPRDILGPFTVPKWGKFNWQVTAAQKGFLVARVSQSTTPGDTQIGISVGTSAGPGGSEHYQNVTGSEQNVYVWVYDTFATGSCTYTLHISIQEGPIDAGSGGGGGYQGGGAGSSNVDQGVTGLALDPDGTWGGGGGGGSSYGDLDDVEFFEFGFEDGFVTIAPVC